MSIKEKLAIWYLKRRVIAALRKAEKMTPLPKWLAWVGNLGALAAVLTAFAGMLPPKYAAIVAALAAWLNSVTHSLPGTGGTAMNP